MKRLNMILLASTSLLLAACAPEPVPVASAPAPVLPAPIVMSNTPIQNEACCFNPAEMVQYRNVSVPDCTKNVEVIRYKNSCVDCAYPVVVRNNSLCAK
jgi:hypothetical protein